MPAAYTGPYTVNPLEMPANQNAAALYSKNPFLPSIVDTSGTTWSSSPLVPSANGAGGMTSFGDVPPTGAVSRTSCAQAALAAEQARLQGQSDRLNRDITVITATP